VGDVRELVGPFRRRPERKLVPRRFTRAALGADLGEDPQQARPPVDQGVDPPDADLRTIDRGEPALAREEGRQQMGELGGE